MSSLSEKERISLDEIFICLEKQASLTTKLSEQKSRMICGFRKLTKNYVLTITPIIKSEKIIFKQAKKVDKTKLFKHFRPKNGASK